MIYARKKLYGMKGKDVVFANLNETPFLSDLLNSTTAEVVMMCGDREDMTREWMEAAQEDGWQFQRKYFHKTRSARFGKDGRFIDVRHIAGDSGWFPGCDTAAEACGAWEALTGEFRSRFDLPLLSTPTKTGQALMWQTFPHGKKYPSLDEDVASLIRNVSTQHRYETFGNPGIVQNCRYFDGRWMYASLATLDRLPVGEPVKTVEFTPYVPGWYRIEFMVPKTWNHIGLLPVKTNDGKWFYPSRFDGEIFETWASEPELTLAQENGWAFEILEGYQFPEKGRCLGEWAKALIELQEDLHQVDEHAARAVKRILVSAIGGLHRNDGIREMVVTRAQHAEMKKERGPEGVKTLESYDDGKVLVEIREKYTDRLSVYMPHWSSQIYALSRTRIARHCLQLPAGSVLEIEGDAIYTTADAPWNDNGNLGQIRLKGVIEWRQDRRKN